MISPAAMTNQAATSPGSMADGTINQSHVSQGLFFFPALSGCFEQAIVSIAVFHGIDAVFIVPMQCF